MRRTVFTVFLSLMAIVMQAQNPITPEGVYGSDPAGHQWEKGGPVYLYTSRDEAPEYWCSHINDVLSSADMVHWDWHPAVLTSKGENDGVSYNDQLLYAPDCMRVGDTYYLYYCQSSDTEVEGVATSKSPTGPFRNGRWLEGATQIDPCAFIDTDGQPYLFYGQFAGKMYRLSKDMQHLVPGTFRDSIITERDHHFHEGIQVVHRDGWYYLVYADISRRGMPTCIGYSMSRHLEGPYEYKGVIIDNFGCDRNVWNNHGSIFEKDGQWYVAYHRSTAGGAMMRKPCVEPIHFNKDGTIPEVEMTTQGSAPPLNPFERMDAWRACYLRGSAQIEQVSPGDEQLTHIRHNSYATFSYFRFGRVPRKVTVAVTPQAGGRLDIFAKTLYAPLLGSFEIPAGDGQTEVTLTMDVPQDIDILGVHPLYLRFTGTQEDTDLFRLNWFKFE